MGIGIAVIGAVSRRKAIGSVLILWVIWIVVKAGFGGLGTIVRPGG
jgi:hypothetical protein